MLTLKMKIREQPDFLHRHFQTQRNKLEQLCFYTRRMRMSTIYSKEMKNAVCGHLTTHPALMIRLHLLPAPFC